MNVDDYLKRIRYTGSREPTLDTLKALCRAHVTTVPYCNYMCFGGPRRIELTYKYMYDSIVTRGQGDYCYTNNALFGWLLTKLGFTIQNGQARSWFSKKGQYSEPYQHMTPVAVINGEEWLYDVGWLLYEPVKMEMMKAQMQRYGIFRIRKAEEENWFILERYRKTILNIDGTVLKQGPQLPVGWEESLDCPEMKTIDDVLWSPQFKFTTEDQPISAFQHMSDYLQDNENSFIRSTLICHMFTEDGMFRMHEGDFVVRRHVNPITDQIIEWKKKITTDEEAEELTEKYTGIKLDFKLNFYKNKEKTIK